MHFPWFRIIPKTPYYHYIFYPIRITLPMPLFNINFMRMFKIK